MKNMIATVLAATVLLLLAVEPVQGMGRRGGTTGRGAVVIAPQQTFVLSNHQAAIVPRPFLFPQRGFLISNGGVVPFGRTFRSGPGVVGSGFVGADVADPYYAYPYPVDAPQIYQPAPVNQPPSVAPPDFCYDGGCYHLKGDGVSVPYQWVWAPALPPSPPGPPPAAPKT